MDMDMPPAATSIRYGQIAAGTVLLVVGATWWLDPAGIFNVPARQLIGPFVLIALGTAIAVGKSGVACEYRGRPDDERRRRPARGRNTNGLWLIGIGAWLLLVQTHAFGLDSHNSWPILVILTGVIMLIRGLR
jgi:hypothetical protein